MTETDLVKRSEVNEMRERIVTLETKQQHAQESIQSLSDKVSLLSSQMSKGFTDISHQMTQLNSRKAMLLTIGGGAGGGVAVGLFSLFKHYLGG
ncbi:hypothetical protein GS501_04480 [Saccharibacter sp. 17.LH.SD]|uniref:hypothetical protein n=1 Tax=Saccharibacter sp. 17.LH.SD TaxID=2689393 RepID=UPI001368ABD5|nr:hypothetical protein [Saccharibacter sp. 17.LH.SD]MXV44302.1 hypothetical protein [Saccharibacter sp. 17.LH.SD]